MAQEKLTMKKSDVEKAFGDYVKRLYKELEIQGKDKPDSIDKVLATIQDREYIGEGKYNVLFDIYGTVVDDNGGQKNNVHYTALCSVSVTPDSEGSPVPTLNESLILTKQAF